MTKADEIKIRKIIQEELSVFFAKTLGLIPFKNDTKKKGALKKTKSNQSKRLIKPEKKRQG